MSDTVLIELIRNVALVCIFFAFVWLLTRD